MARLYKTDTNQRAFEALLAGTKTIEVRTNTPDDPLDYSKLEPGDVLHISLWPEPRSTFLEATVSNVRHYSSARELFEHEGFDKTCSSKPNSIEEAILRIESFTGYREAIKANGIFAVELKDVTVKNQP